MPNQIHHTTTDINNPEQDNPRYHRTWRQKKFSWFYSNLNEPKYSSASSSFIMRHFERLDKFKRTYPRLAYGTQIVLPIILLACIPFAWAVLPSLVTLGLAALVAIQLTITLMSIVLSILSLLSNLIGFKFWGTNTLPFDTLYTKNSIKDLITLKQEHINEVQLAKNAGAITMVRGTAIGTLTCEAGHMPRLEIQAETHADLGYLEGYMQGYQISSMLLNFLQAIPCDEDLELYLPAIEKALPFYYIDEMKAKVKGYQQWCSEMDLPLDDEKKHYKHNLTYYGYLFLQLLPDENNYTDMKLKKTNNTRLRDTNPIMQGISDSQSLGCTTLAFKVGEYTAYMRIVDWYSSNIAGKAFIEIERHVKGHKKVIDTSLSLFSGCLTAFNEDQVLTQINISLVKKVEAKGMPALFFNRYLAENCSNLQDMRTLLEKGDDFIKQGPLGGVFICATDGKDAFSLHAEHQEDNGHVLETMGERPLVVTNFGYDPKTKEPVDTGDSSTRLENINFFFKHHPPENILIGRETKASKFAALREYISAMMKLDLVNNVGSIFAGMYIYENGRLVDSRAATDNTCAGSRAVEDMYLQYGNLDWNTELKG